MLNENLQFYRKKKGLSQEELAAELNVVRQTISKWEKGLSVPDSEMLCALSAVLEVPVTALLGEKAADGNEEPTLTDSEKLDRIAEKLEAVNAQLARQSARRRKGWRIFFFGVAALCAFALFVDVMQMHHLINLHMNASESASVGIIGGADGPTAIFVTSRISPTRAFLAVAGICAALIGIFKTGRKHD
ncbi:MAG: helix-turn-helix domain-containing protein [Oscillospiraceae bacterium]|nr:helix-turn-helix domain-containing protein [Oscillospiraceae bacterium]